MIHSDVGVIFVESTVHHREPCSFALRRLIRRIDTGSRTLRSRGGSTGSESVSSVSKSIPDRNRIEASEHGYAIRDWRNTFDIVFWQGQIIGGTKTKGLTSSKHCCILSASPSFCALDLIPFEKRMASGSAPSFTIIRNFHHAVKNFFFGNVSQ